MLRPSSFGALLSWLRRDVVSADSDADGSFRIAGLAPGTYALWTEAQRRGRAIRTGIVVGDDAPAGEVDLGELPIEAGHRLTVTCTPAARCGTEAAITLPDAEWFR